MKKIKLEVFGPEPACIRCTAVKNISDRLAKRLKKEGFEIEVVKLNIMGKETIEKYGILVSPALAINDVVKFMGRIPSEDEVEREIRKA